MNIREAIDNIAGVYFDELSLHNYDVNWLREFRGKHYSWCQGLLFRKIRGSESCIIFAKAQRASTYCIPDAFNCPVLQAIRFARERDWQLAKLEEAIEWANTYYPE